MTKKKTIGVILWGLVGIVIFLGCFKMVNWVTTQEEDIIYEETTHLHACDYVDGSHSFDILVNDILDKGEGMVIRSSQQEIVVRIGEEILYEYKCSPTQKFGKMPPSKWHVLEIDESRKDQVITIDYYSCYEGFENRNPRIYYGTIQDLIETINMKTLPAWVLGVISILVGALAMLLYFAYQGKHIFYITCFFVTFGLWMIGESKSYFLNYTDLFLQSQITYTCVILMPIFVMLYEKNLLHIKEDRKKTQSVLCYLWFCVADGIFIFLMMILRIGDLVEYMVLAQIVIAIGVFLLLYLESPKMRELYRKGERIHTVITCMFLISVLLELIFINQYGFFYTGIYARSGILIYIVGRYMMELREMKRYREEQEQLRQELEKVNLFMMTDKMKPHFMHNTLVAIQELCYSDSQEAYRAIGIFSKYLRINMEGIGQEQLIPFIKELEMIHLYIEIQKICYEDDIVFEEDIQVEDFSVPPICIQPIIENAIVHGIRKVRRQGKVTLKTWKDQGRIWIQIEDNGVGYTITEEKKEGFSSSMAVTYRIEKILDGTWDVESEVGKGTKVTISFCEKNQGGVKPDGENCIGRRHAKGKKTLGILAKGN